MDYVAGRKITSLSPLRLMELDGRALSEELFRAYLKQILVDGFFHADPHPGNVFNDQIPLSQSKAGQRRHHHTSDALKIISPVE